MNWNWNWYSLRRMRGALILILLGVVFLLQQSDWFHWDVWPLFLVGLVYMFSGIWARAVYGWQRRRRRRPIDTPSPAASTTEPDPGTP